MLSWQGLWRSARGRVLAATGAGCLLLGTAFWLGQLRAGYNALQAELGQRRLQQQVAELEAEKRGLREKLARLETNEKVNREAYREVEEQLVELQGKIIEQQEDLAFYRGVVAGPGQTRLQIRQLTVSPGQTPSSYRLRLVLAQGDRAEREVRGQVQIRVEGNRGSQRVSLDLADLGRPGIRPPPLKFSFRYFQDLQTELALPADFTPARVVIRVSPTSGGAGPTVESFPWTVRAG